MCDENRKAYPGNPDKSETGQSYQDYPHTRGNDSNMRYELKQRREKILFELMQIQKAIDAVRAI